MRKIRVWHVVLVVAVASTAVVATQRPVPSPVPASEPTSTMSKCDPHLWQFVYHPDRLPTKDDCRDVAGVVMWRKAEKDGDYHIRLKLDDPSSAPVNGKNIGGYLVVEPICQRPPVQPDAVEPCSGYDGPHFPLPMVGEHVRVVGFYTLDAQHGWMEIHGVNIIKEIPT